MSHFIANTLTISKDFKTFRVKGGDNNCFPRSNYWSGWNSIDVLLCELIGGSLQFGNSNKEQFLMLDALAVKFNQVYVGKMWEDFHADETPKSLLKLNRRFIEELKIEMKVVNVANYKVKMSGEYVKKVKRLNGCNYAYKTNNIDGAKLYGKYQAKRIMRRFSSYRCEIIEVE